MGTNALREHLQAGNSALGGWCVTPTAYTAELLSTEAIEFICLDCQHGLVDTASLPAMLAAIRPNVTSLVRVASNDHAAIGRALDMGAGGVIVPMVATADEAAQAVAACRYAPRGRRSYGPTRRWLLGGDPDVLEAHAMCLVMLESPDAIERASEICAVDGVDGAYVGPADLAIAMGLRPADMGGSSEHAAAVQEVRSVCERTGRFAGIHTTGGAAARDYFATGFRLCSLPADAVLLQGAVRREIDAARAAGAGERPMRA